MKHVIALLVVLVMGWSAFGEQFDLAGLLSSNQTAEAAIEADLELVHELDAAFGDDNTSPMRYAALYEVAANALGAGDSPREVRERIGEAKDRLGLATDSAKVKRIVIEALEPFAEGEIDPEEFETACRRLAATFLEATR